MAPAWQAINTAGPSFTPAPSVQESTATPLPSQDISTTTNYNATHSSPATPAITARAFLDRITAAPSPRPPSQAAPQETASAQAGPSRLPAPLTNDESPAPIDHLAAVEAAWAEHCNQAGQRLQAGWNLMMKAGDAVFRTLRADHAKIVAAYVALQKSHDAVLASNKTLSAQAAEAARAAQRFKQEAEKARADTALNEAFSVLMTAALATCGPVDLSGTALSRARAVQGALTAANQSRTKTTDALIARVQELEVRGGEAVKELAALRDQEQAQARRITELEDAARAFQRVPRQDDTTDAVVSDDDNACAQQVEELIATSSKRSREVETPPADKRPRVTPSVPEDHRRWLTVHAQVLFVRQDAEGEYHCRACFLARQKQTGAKIEGGVYSEPPLSGIHSVADVVEHLWDKHLDKTIILRQKRAKDGKEWP